MDFNLVSLSTWIFAELFYISFKWSGTSRTSEKNETHETKGIPNKCERISKNEICNSIKSIQILFVLIVTEKRIEWMCEKKQSVLHFDFSPFGF